MAYSNELAIRLIEEIERDLPDFAKAARSASGTIVFHQDAFAADLQPEELARLGKAIKYAGLLGKEVHITGFPRETVVPEKSNPARPPEHTD